MLAIDLGPKEPRWKLPRCANGKFSGKVAFYLVEPLLIAEMQRLASRKLPAMQYSMIEGSTRGVVSFETHIYIQRERGRFEKKKSLDVVPRERERERESSFRESSFRERERER